jgi:hypothetical protein
MIVVDSSSVFRIEVMWILQIIVHVKAYCILVGRAEEKVEMKQGHV